MEYTTTEELHESYLELSKMNANNEETEKRQIRNEVMENIVEILNNEAIENREQLEKDLLKMSIASLRILKNSMGNLTLEMRKDSRMNQTFINAIEGYKLDLHYILTNISTDEQTDDSSIDSSSSDNS